MTNKEYLTKALTRLNVSEEDVDLILLKSGLDADSAVDIGACDMATYRRFSIILKAATQNVSEGGYSISWNMEAVKSYYNALCTELGTVNVLFARPKIRDKSNIW